MGLIFFWSEYIFGKLSQLYLKIFKYMFFKKKRKTFMAYDDYICGIGDRMVFQ